MGRYVTLSLIFYRVEYLLYYSLPESVGVPLLPW